MENMKSAFDSLAEVSAEIDRLDILLRVKMEGFDDKKSQAEFDILMVECNSLVGHMASLYRLEAHLKTINKTFAKAVITK
jgi:hypothetical protein